MNELRTFRARYVVPVEGPPIENGFVDVAQGRIVDVGVWNRSSRRDVLDLGECALLPGFVNAHTHLELTCYADRIPPCGLWHWLAHLIALREAPGQIERERDAVREGAGLSLRAGATTVGDISRLHLAWPVLKSFPLRKVCFAELLCFAARPPRTLDELAAKLGETQTDERLLAGISPHAPYSVTAGQLRGCVELSCREDVPLTVHVAETREERQFIETGTGRLYEILSSLGVVDRIVPPREPLFDYLEEAGVLGKPALLAHVNYVSDGELDRLARSPCSVAFCPRSHRFFGHEPHRFRDMLARGINVCIGTDSLASNESLSVLDELRFLFRKYPQLDATALLAMGTIRGARALRLERHVGSIIPGKHADFTVVPVQSDGAHDPVRNILESAEPPRAVFIAGETAVFPSV